MIICFHNEARSTLERTVYSVLKRSPDDLLFEIILVDDFSDEGLQRLFFFFKFGLLCFASLLDSNFTEYADNAKRIAHHKVRFIRTDEREGLIRARMVGANVSKGQVNTIYFILILCFINYFIFILYPFYILKYLLL